MDRASIVSLFPYSGRGLISFFSDVYYMVLILEYSQSGGSQANSSYERDVLKSSEYSMLKQLIAAPDVVRL